jgi:molybdenum cofactor synthesis domain-containing protein
MTDIIIASRHPNTPVQKGDKICGTKIVPLTIKKEVMKKAEELCGDRKIFNILPYHKKKVGIVTTGSEIFHGRIKDAFGPVLRKKVEEYGGEIIGQTIVDDGYEEIENAIKDYLNKGADMILCSGGMSVDPDDRTPLAIRNTGANVIAYGAPVMPGVMMLLSYYANEGKADIPIIGVPGCVMYAKRTVFDLVLPRLMADDPVTKEELALLGKGGLCLNCDICTYPNCGFGKGW